LYFYYNAQNTHTRGELATASSRGHGSVNSFNCDAKLKKKKGKNSRRRVSFTRRVEVQNDISQKG
jgi:hypothetical protein